MTKDIFTAVEPTINSLRGNTKNSIQTEKASNDLYEDVVIKGGKEKILTAIKDLAAEKECDSSIY